MSLPIAGFCGAGAVCVALALSSGPQQAPVFRATTDVVPLHVSITGQDGRPILGLEVSDFEVYDNGKLAEIAAFGSPPQTVVVTILMSDTKRIVRHLRAVQTAAESLLTLIQSPDRAGVASFRKSGTPLVSDRAKLRAGLEGLLKQPQRSEIGEQFPWDGLDHVRRDLMSPPGSGIPPWFRAWRQLGDYRWSEGTRPDLRAIVVLSSGMDYEDPALQYTGPSKPEEQLVAEILRNIPASNDRHAADVVRAGVVIYGVGFEGTGDDKRLQKLAANSSGWFLQPNSRTNWQLEMGRVMEDLRGRYVIGLVPTSFDGVDHTLEVRLKRPGMKVRARAFYQAPMAGR